MKLACGVVTMLLVQVALIGCGAAAAERRIGWYGPPGHFDRDKYECERDAAMVPRVPMPGALPAPERGGGLGVFGGLAAGLQEGLNRGADQAAMNAAIASEERAQDLFFSCMKARGYTAREE